MKKTLLLALTATLMASSHAKPVADSTLRLAASRVLNRIDLVDATPAWLSHSRLFTGSDGTGFVLLSADDCAFPLLAYSRTEAFSIMDVPEHVASWIKGYDRDIAAAVTLGIDATPEVTDAWRSLLAGTPKQRRDTPVEPLITSLWNQSPLYNSMCPASASGRQAVTGCTATATAQVMRYWGHPAQGRGSHSYTSERYGLIEVNYDTAVYHWDLMPDRLLGSSSQAQVDAVAKLCFHVGVSMDMSYGPGASGAYAHSGGMLQRESAELGLKKYFSYNPGMYTAFKQAFSDEEWDDLISNELNAGRPLIYTGSGTGGHAFIVDGYNEDGLYHVNWGWGGTYNGYYTLSHLTMGREGQSGYQRYNEMNEAIIGMYPITPNESTSTVALVSADPARGTVSGSGTYPVDRDRVLLRAHPAPGFRFSHWASGNTANPIFFYPTTDYADTAHFVPISRDTLGYCHHFTPNFDTVHTMAHCEWGIRIPAGRFDDGRALTQVRTFVYTAGNYVLRIYQSEQPDVPLYEDVFPLEPHGWRTMELASPVDLDPSQVTWITLATDSVIYAQGITPYTGVDDGSWVKNGDRWELVDTLTIGYYTWSIQGILGASAGIASAPDDGLLCHTSSLTLRVQNPQRHHIAVYDLQGRQLASSSAADLSFRLPAAGLYLVKADGHPARRIVATK